VAFSQLGRPTLLESTGRALVPGSLGDQRCEPKNSRKLEPVLVRSGRPSRPLRSARHRAEGSISQSFTAHTETLAFGNGGPSTASGPSVGVFDAPGLALTDPGNNKPIVWPSATWFFILNVTVTDGHGAKVACPPVYWGLTINWYTDAKGQGIVSGGADVYTTPGLIH